MSILLACCFLLPPITHVLQVYGSTATLIDYDLVHELPSAMAAMPATAAAVPGACGASLGQSQLQEAVSSCSSTMTTELEPGTKEQAERKETCGPVRLPGPLECDHFWGTLEVSCYCVFHFVCPCCRGVCSCGLPACATLNVGIA